MMGTLAAFVRQDMLTQASYRVNSMLSLLGIVFGIVPLYYVAAALQPVMARSISDQGGQYFSFVLLGLVALRFVWAGVSTLPAVVGSAIGSGTLETILSTPIRHSTLLVGMITYKVLWAVVEALVLLGAGMLLGARLVGSHVLIGIVILLLITAAYAAFGIFGSAMLLTIRTSGPLLTVVGAGSMLLGGVYYPKHVIPSWIQSLSSVIPLTYGLRALRRTLLDGASLSAVAGDVLTLAAIAVVLVALSLFAFEWALRFARRAGTMAQY